MSGTNVLRLNAKEEEAAYRTAISRIICDLEREHDLTDIDLADRIDVSAETISNARNKKCNLNVVYLKRIGQAFGASAIDPYLALLGARGVPIEPGAETDALPKIAELLSALASASHAAPNGVVPHTKLLPIMPQINAAMQSLSALKQRGDKILQEVG